MHLILTQHKPLLCSAITKCIKNTTKIRQRRQQNHRGVICSRSENQGGWEQKAGTHATGISMYCRHALSQDFIVVQCLVDITVHLVKTDIKLKEIYNIMQKCD